MEHWMTAGCTPPLGRYGKLLGMGWTRAALGFFYLSFYSCITSPNMYSVAMDWQVHARHDTTRHGIA